MRAIGVTVGIGRPGCCLDADFDCLSLEVTLFVMRDLGHSATASASISSMAGSFFEIARSLLDLGRTMLSTPSVLVDDRIGSSGGSSPRSPGSLAGMSSYCC